MVEFELQGETYSVGRLNAFQQLHLSRKLAPVLPALVPFLQVAMSGGLERALSGDLEEFAAASRPIASVLSQMPDADAEYIICTALSCVKRKQGKFWHAMVSGGTMAYDDTPLDAVLMLALRSIKENLGSFIQGFVTRAMTDLKAAQDGESSPAEKTGF